jgi:hemolysin activation/secretion protein
MNKNIIWLTFLMLVNYPINSHAQNRSLFNTPPLEQPPQLEPLPPLEEVLPESLPSNLSQPSPLEEIPGEITINKFAVIGSTVFTEKQLAEILEPYINKPITFAQLVEARNAITQLYQQKGYITSGAFIPAQTLSDGVITIQVIEGTVESIEIKGLNRLESGYIRSRIQIAVGPPLNQQELLKALQLLQINPLIANISAELQAGTEVGKSILVMNITESNIFHLTARYDNYRNPSVGTNRILGEMSIDNVSGWGDRFNLSYYHTEGSDSIDDLSYTLPINAHNGSISFSFQESGSKVIDPAIFEPFRLESEYRKYELSYRQPIIQNINEELTLGISTDWQTTANFLLGEPFPLSIGADSQGKTRIFALRLFQEYSKRSDRSVFFVRSQFNFGLNAFGATSNNDKPDSNFFSWRGQVQYVNALTADVLLVLKSDLQFANEALLPLEKFSLGGAYSVRGYSQDALLADNGLFISAELRTNILKIPEWNTSLQLSPFLDFGRVWNSDDTPLVTNVLFSTGIGLNLFVDDIFSAGLEWGIPLSDFDEISDSLQADGIYFYFQLKPFQ